MHIYLTPLQNKIYGQRRISNYCINFLKGIEVKAGGEFFAKKDLNNKYRKEIKILVNFGVLGSERYHLSAFFQNFKCTLKKFFGKIKILMNFRVIYGPGQSTLILCFKKVP